MTGTPLPISDIDPFLLDNLRSEDTGVDGAVIWTVCAVDVPHKDIPRLYVLVGNKLSAATAGAAVPITLADPPVVLGYLPPDIAAKAVEFATLNRDVLLRYWNCGSSMEMVNSIKRVGG